MPFQALPLALRKSTGTPISKLLYIHLMGLCRLPSVADLGVADRQSDVIDFRPEDSAAFCQCTIDEVYEAMALLERLQLVLPCEGWVWDREFENPRDRWEFVYVRLPMSQWASDKRTRIKATPDQLASLHAIDEPRVRGACPTCSTIYDEVQAWAVDHILPRSRGGADVEENCQAICDKCNARKHARTDWVDFLGGRNG